jgi:hypothetical protein
LAFTRFAFPVSRFEDRMATGNGKLETGILLKRQQAAAIRRIVDFPELLCDIED